MFKHGESVKKRSWMKIIVIMIPITLVFVGGSFIAVNQWYEDNLQSVSETFTESAR